MLNVWSGMLGGSSVADGIASNTGVAIPRSSGMLGGSLVADGITSNEPRHEKIGFLHMRKQRRDQLRLCFRYTDSAIPLLLKSEISSL